MSFAPNRFGDRAADPIFLALGRAVSAWEGVQVASANLFRALVASKDQSSADADCWKFARVMKVPDRARKIRAACNDCLSKKVQPIPRPLERLVEEVENLMTAYIGWSTRRNELAHGYVTSSWGNDPVSDSDLSEENFALCPSHARLHNWHDAEPEFNYVASEIEAFAGGFKKLDAALETAAKKVVKLRT